MTEDKSKDPANASPFNADSGSFNETALSRFPISAITCDHVAITRDSGPHRAEFAPLE